MTYGVVDAAVYVGSAFQAYGGGIYEDSRVSCDSSPCYYTSVNHAIALVGWNDNGDPDNQGYWILRNSWGPSWGEDGYMRIKYRSARVACEGTYFVLEQVPVCEEDDSGALDIPGGFIPPGFEVSIPVRIQNAPNRVNAFGFEVTFPDAILTFSDYTIGNLVQDWYYVDVTSPAPGIIRVGGFTAENVIEAGESGVVVYLNFNTLACDQGSVDKLDLQGLKDDTSEWTFSHGCFQCACSCDVNGDGEITPGDALCAFEKYMGICPTNCGPCDEICCDVNMDGECTPADALEVFREYMGEPSVCSPPQ